MPRIRYDATPPRGLLGRLLSLLRQLFGGGGTQGPLGGRKN